MKYMRRGAHLRRVAIILGALLVVAVLGLVIFFQYPISDAIPRYASRHNEVKHETPSFEVPFERLAQGKQSAIGQRVNYIITTPEDLGTLWKTIKAPGTPPTIDFSKKQVLAIFSDTAQNASISVAHIKDSAERMVSIVVSKIEGSCSKRSTAALYQFVTVPASELPITHEDITATTSCTN